MVSGIVEPSADSESNMASVVGYTMSHSGMINWLVATFERETFQLICLHLSICPGRQLK